MPHPSSSSNGPEDSLSGQVAAEFSKRLARGEPPGIDECPTRYPQIPEWIRDVFPALQALHDPAAVNGTSHGRTDCIMQSPSDRSRLETAAAQKRNQTP
jgi:hypothetical protein